MSIMFFRSDAAAKLAALKESQATIEFKLDGTIITANENFLRALGYELNEVVGKHHSMFLDPEERESREYKDFWNSLKRGEFQRAQYRQGSLDRGVLQSGTECARKALQGG